MAQNIEVKQTDKAACSLCLANSTIIIWGRMSNPSANDDPIIIRAILSICDGRMKYNTKYDSPMQAMIDTTQSKVRREITWNAFSV